MTDPPPPTDERLCSIGSAASAAGLSPGTVRVWERRYGRPVPVRLASGHRRYTAAQVRWLRRVAEALARGHRPSVVVPATERELDELLDRPSGEPRPSDETERMMQLVAEGRGHELAHELHGRWAVMGPRRFVFECLAPLIEVIGQEWADGRIAVRHEHLASEHIGDLLRTLRRALPAPGRRVLLITTLPGETHALGLQMAALIARLEGADVRVLGTGTPEPEIVSAAAEQGAAAVAISVSLSTGGPDTDRRLAALRAELPDDVELVVGGRGARGVRRGVRGVRYEDFDGFGGWLRTFCAGKSRQ